MTVDLEATYRSTRGLVEHHEAAHALVAHHLRLPLARVQVGMARESGYCQLGRGVTDPWKRLCVLVAGSMGERLAPAWDHRLDRLSAGDDQQGIDDALTDLDWRTAEPAEDEVDLILLDHRRALRRLADVLVERRVLDGAEVRAIIDG
jgi:hypothetical protein